MSKSPGAPSSLSSTTSFAPAWTSKRLRGEFRSVSCGPPAVKGVQSFHHPFLVQLSASQDAILAQRLRKGPCSCRGAVAQTQLLAWRQTRPCPANTTYYESPWSIAWTVWGNALWREQLRALQTSSKPALSGMKWQVRLSVVSHELGHPLCFRRSFECRKHSEAAPATA